ncbi:helix-turn-helix domain-containing protein [Sphingomonas melonis]
MAATFRAIRKRRRMRAAEVARAMGMAPRSYEHLEAGTGRITYERIVDFAEATDSDPIAILATLSFGSAEFALRCIDNKLMTIMMIALMELDADLGDDLTYLDAQTLVGGFTRLTRDLAQHVRKRETFAEEWLKQGSSRLSPARTGAHPPKLKPVRGR